MDSFDEDPNFDPTPRVLEMVEVMKAPPPYVPPPTVPTPVIIEEVHELHVPIPLKQAPSIVAPPPQEASSSDAKPV
jgi:hypothetical protein